MINEGDVRRIGLHKTQKRKMMQSKSAGEDKIQRTHREKKKAILLLQPCKQPNNKIPIENLLYFRSL